ncbi:MAG: sodium:proton antiporter [Cytophagales bacterium]|nr:sodium:proton antiporter [Cytophagales bacterium]
MLGKQTSGSPGTGTNHEIALWKALLPVILLMILLSLNIFHFGSDALSGSMQTLLILISGFTAAWGIVILRVRWKIIQEGILKGIYQVLEPILILLLVGALAGTWMLSGIIPTLIYYGLKILHPSIFLLAACLIASAISLITGSSWSTIATFGLALLAIGKAMGFHEGWIAGAIISGAYFGDKMSPLSDTTVLAPAVARTDVPTHIRAMLSTSLPSFSLAVLIYLIKGFVDSPQSVEGLSAFHEISDSLRSQFLISPALLLFPVGIFLLIRKGIPAIPSLFIGAVGGGLLALCFQYPLLKEMCLSAENEQGIYHILFKAFYTNTNYHTGHELLDNILPTRGMEGMLLTIWLILTASTFGGVMEATNCLRTITQALTRGIHSALGLLSSVLGSCLFINIVVGDQYLSILLPGSMARDSFQEKNLPPELLSRTLEDSGTVTSVLVPWNTCGATQATVLGVATLSYLPYAFFNLFSPLVSLAVMIMGQKFSARISKIPSERDKEENKNKA